MFDPINKMMRKLIFLFGFLSVLSFHDAEGQYYVKDPRAISLDGEWSFAMDPLDVGQSKGWYKQDFPKGRWDEVEVPHCFSADPRYQYYTGTVWYKRTFPWKPRSGERIILHFDAVYYAASVWINDRKAGAHEGGYTPFELDVTDYLRDGDNTIALSVNNNTWRTGTVPGAKDYGLPGDPFMGWMNYGGIIRPVYLTIEPETYIDHLKVEAVPDLNKGNAIISVISYLKHTPDHQITSAPSLSVRFHKKLIKLDWRRSSHPLDSNDVSIWKAQAVMHAGDMKLWDIDDPNLYELQAVYKTDTLTTTFGIRTVEVKNARLLLNGHPVRAAGANRVIDYPGLGSLEPDSLVEKDFRLMKEGGMIFQRMTHYTPNEYFYQLADKYGMLIIAEAGNWQLTPDQMDNDTIRQKYRSQLLEMMHRDWNHPSVIAYSVGNEYSSDSPSGKRWTKDMIAFGRSQDSTRLFTFVSSKLNKLPKKADDEASMYCDFVCTNTYGNHEKVLEHIHQLYPQKPVLLSEWGLRVDHVGDSGLIRHIRKVADIIREHPYVIGASIWTYNDYVSRFVGTNKNGYRGWGLVDAYRNPRSSYFTYQYEMCPLIMEAERQKMIRNGEYEIPVRLSGRSDFPSYPLRHYILKSGDDIYPVPDMMPGDTITINISKRGLDNKVKLALYTPTGFCILHQDIKIHLSQ
jgi:beta-glucuronidase